MNRDDIWLYRWGEWARKVHAQVGSHCRCSHAMLGGGMNCTKSGCREWVGRAHGCGTEQEGPRHPLRAVEEGYKEWLSPPLGRERGQRRAGVTGKAGGNTVPLRQNLSRCTGCQIVQIPLLFYNKVWWSDIKVIR